MEILLDIALTLLVLWLASEERKLELAAETSAVYAPSYSVIEEVKDTQIELLLWQTSVYETDCCLDVSPWDELVDEAGIQTKEFPTIAQTPFEEWEVPIVQTLNETPIEEEETSIEVEEDGQFSKGEESNPAPAISEIDDTPIENKEITGGEIDIPPEPKKQCTHCGSTSYVKNGSKKGKQYYKCKECKRSFRLE